MTAVGKSGEATVAAAAGTTSVTAAEAAAIRAEAEALAFPRYPGTDGDRRAIAWVAERMEALGLEVETQRFSYDVGPAFTALRALLVALAAALAAAASTAPRDPRWAALSLAGALGAAGVLLGWAPWLERLYRRPGRTETANVIGTRRPGAAPRWTLVLVAHHDSKSQNLTMLARGGLTILALAATAVLAVVAVAAWLGGPPVPRGLAYGCGGVGGLALAVLATLRSGDRSPGGVDNAGSVALMLFLARRLLRTLADDVALVVLSPGAEEDHMVGAMRWLDREAPALGNRPVFALNFDGAGAPGRLALLERFGFGRRFSATLSRLARAAARAEGLGLRGVYLPPAMGVDAIPFAHRGIDCLTISSGRLDRATLAVHSAADVAANLDAETLARAARLALALVDQLATLMCQGSWRTP